ncbi:MAG: hypothetical protein AAFZ92_04630 [Pseudomonadota bacterium]
MINRVSLFATVLFIISCSQIQPYKITDALQTGSDKGGLVLSASWSDDPSGAKSAAESTSSVTFSYRSLGHSAIKGKVVVPRSKWRKGVDFRPDAPMGEGSIFGLALADGDYEFYRWTVYQGKADIIYNSKAFSIPFTVKQGELSYIGELNLDIFRRENLYGYGIFDKGTLSLGITDSTRERDLGIMSERYPEISSTRINDQYIDFKPVLFSLYSEAPSATLRDTRIIFHNSRNPTLFRYR